MESSRAYVGKQTKSMEILGFVFWNLAVLRNNLYQILNSKSHILIMQSSLSVFLGSLVGLGFRWRGNGSLWQSFSCFFLQSLSCFCWHRLAASLVGAMQWQHSSPSRNVKSKEMWEGLVCKVHRNMKQN